MNKQFGKLLCCALNLLVVGILLSVKVAHAAGDETLLNLNETRSEVSQYFASADWARLDQMGSQRVRAYEKDANRFAALRTFFYVLPKTESSAALEGYNAWVTRFPKSYAALYARARYLAYQAMATRGGDFVDKVPAEQLQKMEDLFASAHVDLLRSVGLSTRPVMSYFQLIRKERYYGDAKKAWYYYQASERADPDILIIAEEYLFATQPRWGGSFKALHNFPDEARKRGLSASKVADLKAHARYLEGRDYLLYGDEKRANALFTEVVNEHEINDYKVLALIELANLANADRDFDGSSRLLRQALNIKPNDVRLLVEAAASARDGNRPQESLTFYDRAIALAPDDIWALSGRGWVRHKILGDHAAAFPDMHKAARLGEPVAQNVLGYFYWEGIAADKNRGEALYWWTLSAKQKNKTAEENLAMAKHKLGENFGDTLDAALRVQRP